MKETERKDKTEYSDSSAGIPETSGKTKIAAAGRELHIELLRCLAAFMVIAIHISLPNASDGELNRTALAFNIVIADAVAIFWAITGCFWFDKDQPYTKVIRNFMKNVFVPMILAVMFIMIFRGFIEGGNRYPHLSDLSGVDWKQLAAGLLTRQENWCDATSPYWYMFEFLRLVCWWPIVHAVCRAKNGDRIVIGLIVFHFVCIAVGELGLLVGSDFIRQIPYAFLPTSLCEMLLGRTLYRNRERLRKIPLLPVLLMLLLSQGLRWLAQGKMFYRNPDEWSYLFWYSSFSFVVVTALFITAFRIPLKQDGAASRAISFMGKYSYFVFLIHEAVICKLKGMDILSALQNLILNGNQTPAAGILHYLIYYIAATVLVYALALLPAIAAHKVYYWCVGKVSKCRGTVPAKELP